MKDPNRDKYHKLYKREFNLAADILGDIPDGEIGWCKHDWQAFYFRCENVNLIFYPHKTKGTGNIHIRVRNQNSKDFKKAVRLMRKLYDNTFGNTFWSKAFYKD